MKQNSDFAYFGTPMVARDTLATLIARGFVPSVIITLPDAPQGRGLAFAPSPVKVMALEEKIPVLTPERLTAESIATICTYECKYAIVVAYGKLFPEMLITAFPKGVLNVHYSLLPKYRGATPLEAALIKGDSETGITIQKMTKELDAGDVLAQITVKIAPLETARELRPRLVQEGAELLVNVLPTFNRGESVPIPQDPRAATHTGKLKKEDGLIDITAPAQQNWNTYRAYADTIGTYFFQNGKRMKITKASFENERFIVERVVPEGKREMPYAGFLRTEHSR